MQSHHQATISEITARIMKRDGRNCAFKPGNMLGQQLFRLKVKAASLKMADVIYKVLCKDCPISEKPPDCCRSG